MPKQLWKKGKRELGEARGLGPACTCFDRHACMVCTQACLVQLASALTQAAVCDASTQPQLET